jgi:translation initiation factor 3 subunit I
MQISWTRNDTLFISASKDGTAKLFDAKTFQPIKTYHTGRPINTSSVSPIRDEVILAGGQSADQVTTTRVDNTQFRVRFYHLIFEEELGSLPGHFGPVNCVSYSPDGKGFSSGGEDGYVRLHHFDANYFSKFGKDV